ncbi:hypothetical protein [Ruthenibacterium lactatiformans]|uniref:hypothetical protein n=1 Tax=Ruthenibacterium lactatiformans TaxID=1550024 RepID=UPI00308102AF
MNDGMDYEVLTKVSFRLIFDSNGEMNLLSLPEIRQGFVSHVKEVYEQDETLRDYVSGDLNFQFIGSTALLEYTFSCCDEDEAEAESFSEYCVREVQAELEEFGCRITQIQCEATEADITWWDQFEDAVFGPRDKLSEQADPDEMKMV